MDAKRVSKKPNGSWEKDKQKALEVMLRQFNNERNDMTATDFAGKRTRKSPSSLTSSGSESHVEDLSQGQKCLDLKTGAVYYVNSEAETRQSSKSRSSEEGFDLKSCFPTSKDLNEKNAEEDIIEEEAATMRLVGCSKCLMYSMVSNQDPKCPTCKGSSLLHFPNEDSSSKQVHTWK